ncbi:MAG: ABC transporter substrate-binding protein [Pseudomonadota bacterium]
MKHGFTAAAAIAALGLTAVSAQARDFTIASWGGAYQEGQRDIYFTPFGDAEGVQVLEDVYLGGWAQFKAMQETGNIPWDVVQVESAEVARGCEEGLFLELDWDRLGGRDSFIDGGASDCGMGVVVVSEVIAYRADLVDGEGPKTLADFFDLEKFPGSRGMRDEPKYNLVRALLADGVPADQIHDVLGTPEGLDRAFAKLDTIKSEVTFWSAGAQAPERLAAGDYVVSIAYNGRITNAERDGAENLEMVWDNHIAYLDQWVILADSPNVELAYKYLEYYADPGRQIAYSKEKLPYGPPLIEAAAAMPPEMAAELPVGENMATAFVTGTPKDVEFWLDNLDEITERWNAWKVQN